jgi:hypothetical protein
MTVGGITVGCSRGEKGMPGHKVNFIVFRDLPSDLREHLKGVQERRKEINRMRADRIPGPPGRERRRGSAKKIAIFS